MEQRAYRRVVERVAVLRGGAEQLAVLLRVSPSLVSRWVEGLAPVPPDVFLRCVDYLLDDPQGLADPARRAGANEQKLNRPE